MTRSETKRREAKRNEPQEAKRKSATRNDPTRTAGTEPSRTEPNQAAGTAFAYAALQTHPEEKICHILERELIGVINDSEVYVPFPPQRSDSDVRRFIGVSADHF